MIQRNENTNSRFDLDNLSIKEALTMDVAHITMRSKIFSDPYMPFVPITPIVVGKKMIKGVRSILRNAKK